MIIQRLTPVWYEERRGEGRIGEGRRGEER
jgi:hypothetical protein